MSTDVTVLGIFVADALFRGSKAPMGGETVLAHSLQISQGGKGSNQAVAAARAGGRVNFLTRLGDDAFSGLAADLWQDVGVDGQVIRDKAAATGMAAIFINETTSENQIIVCPGAAMQICPEDVDNWGTYIKSAKVFLTQLEQPLAAAEHALQMAKGAGVTTILNPAPAVPLAKSVLQSCDYLTPNESEAEILTGIKVETFDDARMSADHLLDIGTQNVVITMGGKGALLHNRNISEIVPAIDAGSVVDTTGAGDAFNGAFAVALSKGEQPLDAVRFGCAVAGLSVTKPGAAASMPALEEVRAFLN